MAGGIPTYAALRVRDLYPGIDLVYYTGRHGLEYDFVVGPGPIRAASASPPPGLRRTPGMAIWSGAPRAAQTTFTVGERRRGEKVPQVRTR